MLYSPRLQLELLKIRLKGSLRNTFPWPQPIDSLGKARPRCEGQTRTDTEESPSWVLPVPEEECSAHSHVTHETRQAEDPSSRLTVGGAAQGNGDGLGFFDFHIGGTRRRPSSVAPSAVTGTDGEISQASVHLQPVALHKSHEKIESGIPTATRQKKQSVPSRRYSLSRQQKVLATIGLIILLVAVVLFFSVALPRLTRQSYADDVITESPDRGDRGRRTKRPKDASNGRNAVFETTATFHAEHAGTAAISREKNLRHLGCTDHFAGWGHPGPEAQDIAAGIVSAMNEYITSSRHANFPCGSCVRLENPANGHVEYVTVVDIGGTMFDLHPEIFYRLFGVDENVQIAEDFWDTEEKKERYMGMGGNPAVLASMEEAGANCQGWTAGGEPAGT